MLELGVHNTRYVALLAEGVDRNQAVAAVGAVNQPVALLAEGVDRNQKAPSDASMRKVALLAEGVDRNRLYQIHTKMH